MALIGLMAIVLVAINRSALTSGEMILSSQIAVSSLLAAALVMAVLSLWTARKLMVPLGRLIEKSRRLHRAPFQAGTIDGSDWTSEEPGEWYELERALNDLGRDLQEKTIRLSREKTELRAIMASLNEAVLAIDAETRPLFFNPPFALLFSSSRTLGEHWSLTDIVRSPDLLSAFHRALNEGSSEQVAAVLEVGNSVRHFQVSISALRKRHNHEIYGAVAVFYDVSEMKKAEQIRLEFVENVSHELKTPLTSIKGYLQTVMSDLEANRMEDIKPFLKIVQKNSDRLLVLVKDLLDLSILQSSGELLRSKVDLHDLTHQVLNQVDLRQHKVKLHFQVDSFFGDALRLEQLLRNLLQNAARYVPAGGLIEISWCAINGMGVELRVKDNGPGIPKEHQARLFERFYRVDEARSRQLGGSGIGLSLVKHIAQRHDGKVRVESAPGKGAEFICEFPRARDLDAR